MTLDIDHLLTELTLEQEASLTSGSSFLVHRAGGRLGILETLVSDGASACDPTPLRRGAGVAA